MGSHDFTQKMRRLSDEELSEIAGFGEKDGYLPEAVVAARNELVARNLSSTDLSTIAETVETQRNREVELASRPLSWPARLAFLMFPMLGWPFMIFIALSLGTRGYRRKSSEAWKLMGLGLALWIGLVVGLVVLQLENN